MATDASTAPDSDSLAAVDNAAAPAMVIPAQSLDSAGSSDHGPLHAESTANQATRESPKPDAQSGRYAAVPPPRTESHAPRLLLAGPRPLSAPPVQSHASSTSYSTVPNVTLVPFEQIYNMPRPASLTAQADDLRRTSVSTSAAESEEDASQVARYIHLNEASLRGSIGARAAAIAGSAELAQTEPAVTVDLLASATRTVSQPPSGVSDESKPSLDAFDSGQKRKRERSEAAGSGSLGGSTPSASQTADPTAAVECATSPLQGERQQPDSPSRSSSAAAELDAPPAQRRRTEPAPDSFGVGGPNPYTLSQLQEAQRLYAARFTPEYLQQLHRLHQMQMRASSASASSSAAESGNSAAAQTSSRLQTGYNDHMRGASTAYATNGTTLARSNGAQSTFSINSSQRFPGGNGHQYAGEGVSRVYLSTPSKTRIVNPSEGAMTGGNGSYSTTSGALGFPAQAGQYPASHYAPPGHNGSSQVAYSHWNSAAPTGLLPNGLPNESGESTPSPASASTAYGSRAGSSAAPSTVGTVATSYRADVSMSPVEERTRTPIPLKKAKPVSSKSTSSKSATYAQALTANAEYGGDASNAAEIPVAPAAAYSYQQSASPFSPPLQPLQPQYAPAGTVPSASAVAQAPQKKSGGRRAAPDDAYNISPIAGMKPFICKLRWLVSNPSEVGDVVTWASDGATVLVKVAGDVTKMNSVLLRTYAHENASAFCRQFVVYGFTQIKDAAELEGLLPTGAAVAEWRAFYDKRNIFVQASMDQTDALKSLVPRKEPKKGKEVDNQEQQQPILVTTPQPQAYQYSPYSIEGAQPLANVGASTLTSTSTSTSTSPQGYRAAVPGTGEPDQSAASMLYNPHEEGRSVASLIQEASPVPRMGGVAQPMQGLFRSRSATSGESQSSEDEEAGSA